MLQEGGTLQTYITGVCGECSQCLGHTGLAHSMCVFPSILLRLQVALQGNCLKRALGCLHFSGLSRSRFRFSGTPQRHSLGWACVLCPSQIRASQATRCLASALSPGVWCVLSPPCSQPLGFLGAQHERLLVSGVPCVSSGELISGCDPPGRCQPSRIPGRLR